jgi:hypothetical protein
VGVDLRRSKALVPEQLLNNTKICTAVKEVRSKGVAKSMRMECLWEASGACDVIQSCTGPTLSERSAVAIQEECRGWGCGEFSERRSSVRQVRLKRTTARRAEERNTLLVTLPCHLHLAATKLQVGDVDRHNFCNAQASAVEEFDQRCVAQRERS